MDVTPYLGTLNNTEIELFCDKDLLITENFDKKNIKQACYQLRASSIYYVLPQESDRIDIKQDKYDYILIKPNQSVVVITKEKLSMPADVLGRVLTKGLLFSVGLAPVNTYVDPGFSGNLGIILHNNSTNYLKLYEGEPIAKIEFSVLKNPVTTPYEGQHGYNTGIWPMTKRFELTADEIKMDRRIGTPADEIQLIYGRQYSRVINNLVVVEKKLIIAAIIFFIFNILLIAVLQALGNKDWLGFGVSTLVGLAVNIISFLFIFKIENSKWINAQKKNN